MKNGINARVYQPHQKVSPAYIPGVRPLRAPDGLASHMLLRLPLHTLSVPHRPVSTIDHTAYAYYHTNIGTPSHVPDSSSSRPPLMSLREGVLTINAAAHSGNGEDEVDPDRCDERGHRATFAPEIHARSPRARGRLAGRKLQSSLYTPDQVDFERAGASTHSSVKLRHSTPSRIFATAARASVDISVAALFDTTTYTLTESNRGRLSREIAFIV
ncbi:hypothetical protein BOTBODRAFT_172487 [Botryobasidium botryosum FD-172 SS1]|uniref:Uncharacterized protein n=1 Tax=Botryobasidium botryosum (strain FD-172 SS1) TaxID=930990 RepID=A0A067MYC7_BOTB1|nr:hypothetical protein BOTBODRAFT_172487 [Botryobasidium botryosum FD-172 SS1]